MPEVASRQHVATIVPVLARAVAEAGDRARAIWTASRSPRARAWSGALLVGVETAKSLAYALGKPLVGVNHLAGHLAAVFLDDRRAGHAAAAPGRRSRTWRCWFRRAHGAHPRRRSGRTALLGATRDDAAGEAFDKVGKMLGLGYPGGVAIDSWPRPATRRRSRCRARSRAATISTSASPGSRRRCRRCCAGARVPSGRRAGRFLRQLPGRGRRRAGPQVAPRGGAAGLPHLVVCGGVAANRGLRAAWPLPPPRMASASTSRRPSAAPTTRR